MMNSLAKTLSLVAAIALILLGTPQSMSAQTTAPCVLGYTVGFFNGVWNTEAEATDGLNALQASIRQATGNSNDTYNDEEVGYQLFYNHTGSAVGSTGLQDIAEVFIQRANQLDPSGYFSGNNFYLFWDSLTGTPNFSDPVSAVSSTIGNFLSQFVTSTVTSAVATLAATFYAPPTTTDYGTQDATLSTLAAAGRKFLLVAHSQGNLFVDPAYDFIMPTVGSTRVKVVHVAPASPTLRGNYILSGNDLVINGLRLDGGFTTVPANNIVIPASTGDPSGHTLVGTYLDETRNGYAAVTTQLTNGLGALQQGTCPVQLSPLSSKPSPGGTIAYTATVNAPTTGAVLGLGYAWNITGNAGGTFTGGVTTIDTTAPNVTYTASSTATAGQVDTIGVTAYAVKTVGSLVGAEQLGTASATATIGGGGLVNGDFSQGLTGWTPSGQVSISTSESYGCLPSQTGNPFASFNNYGSDISLTQTFTVPSSATTLSLNSWNNLDPVEVRVSIINSLGGENVLGDFEPPSVQGLSDPNNYYSVVCEASSPGSYSYSIAQYAGQTVTLRLRGIYIGGINGTFANFDNVVVK